MQTRRVILRLLGAVLLAFGVAWTSSAVETRSVAPLPPAPPHPYREDLSRHYRLALPDAPSEAEQSSLLLKRCCGEGAASASLPCDAVTCVGAHSLNRRIVTGYSSNLFQLSRSGGGGGTQNIGMVSGIVDTGAIATFCGSSWPMSNGAGANSCAFHIVYDQSGNSNNLTTCGTCTDIAFSSNPANNNIWTKVTGSGTYMNIDFATNAPSAGGAKSVFVVANDTNTSDSGDGTYGLYHRVADPSTVGTDFAIDVRSGINGQPVRLMGVDLEQDVMEVAYGYGNTDVIPASTNLQTPLDYVGIATAASGATPVSLYYNNVFTYSANYVPSSGPGFATGASIRLGAGGDGTPAKSNWYEGGIVGSVIASTARATIFNNTQTYYGISTAGTCTEGANSQSINHFVTVAGAWGLRKIVPNGNTPLAVIERASDSTVQIINSSGCDFDTATANTFCNATTCRVMLLPDQAPWPSFGHQDLYTQTVTCSFCGTYLEQTTFANGPALTFNCVGSTKVCMTFTGSESLASKNNQTVATPYSVFGVSNRNSGASYGSVFGDGGNVMFLGGGSSANLMLFQANSSGAVDTVTAADGSWFAIAGTVPSSTSENACVAGSCTLLSSITTTGLSNVQYGIGIGFNDWKGTITETALVTSDVTSSVSSIASAQKAYWGY